MLGVGREGTRVYSAGDAPELYPSATGARVFAYSDASDAVVSMRRAFGDPLEGAAVKDIPDEASAITESHLHQRIHGWFVAARSMDATPLHPAINCVDVLLGGDRTHRLLVYREMEGDISDLNLSEEGVWNVAASVLRALMVLHSNGMMHLDVKPHNVLYKTSSPPPGFAYVLGDYGVATPTQSVFNAAVRGQPTSGTDGYISPLLLLDDADNNVFDVFEAVAAGVQPTGKGKGKRGGAAPLRPKAASDAAWTAYFEAHRIAALQDVYKADLHSLALLLYRVAQWNDLAASAALTRFIAALMFFRPGDPLTAEAALSLVAKHTKRAKRRP
jgi:serine/threonine protein kinase